MELHPIWDHLGYLATGAGAMGFYIKAVAAMPPLPKDASWTKQWLFALAHLIAFDMQKAKDSLNGGGNAQASS
jgi:hypothetical protein